MWSKNALQPTPVGTNSSAFAGHDTDPAWLTTAHSVLDRASESAKLSGFR
jgi:hypothetical protein